MHGEADHGGPRGLPEPPAARDRRPRGARGRRDRLPDRPGPGGLGDRRGEEAGRGDAAPGPPRPPLRGAARQAARTVRAASRRCVAGGSLAVRGRGDGRADLADRRAVDPRAGRAALVREGVMGARRGEPPGRRARRLAGPVAPRGASSRDAVIGALLGVGGCCRRTSRSSAIAGTLGRSRPWGGAVPAPGRARPPAPAPAPARGGPPPPPSTASPATWRSPAS